MPNSPPGAPPPSYPFNWPVQAARLLRLYAKTFRMRVFNHPSEPDKAKIFALWHEKQMAALSYFGPFGYTILASLSRDGEYIAQGARILGYDVVRGSSSRGGLEALWRLKTVLKSGRSVILTVDGPRGPRREAKPGAAILAARSGCPIYPAGIAAERRWILKSWDKMIIPWPFTRVVTYFGEPVSLPEGAAKWPKEELGRITGTALLQAEQEAWKRLEIWRGRPAAD